MTMHQQSTDFGGIPQGQVPMNTPPAPSAPVHRRGDETKAAFKTTELIVYLATVVGVLIAAAVVDADQNGQGGFGAERAWFYVALLTIGYLISRGLAKSGSHHEG